MKPAFHLLIASVQLTCLLTFFEMGLAVAQVAKRPNIVWIVCEDIGPYIGAYGYKGVKTPTIDQLAREGELYTKAYTTAGVCAPSRSSLITGMYQTSIGTMHMRTLNEDNPKNSPLPSYSAVIPPYVKCFPEYLRLAGYYTTNNEKQDYQFEPPVTVWDENSAAASWRNRAPNQPFFSIINLAITHEMNLFAREKEPLTVDPKVVDVPAYYNKTETAAKAMARQLTNIERMDGQVGEIIARLKEDGLYDNTWIMFYSDHGGALPWMKRELLERGTHIPFIVKYPKGENAGRVNNNLISGVDFAPTVLSIAGVPIPQYMQGQAFLGDQKSAHSRKYIYFARDRMATQYDRVRAVSDGRFKYLYNYMPDVLYYQDLNFRKSIPLMKEILTMKESGTLNPLMMRWFDTKPVEELYDTEADPDEFKNLANDPHYANNLNEMRAAFAAWRSMTVDMGATPEKEMLTNWWNGQNEPPQTATIMVIRMEKGIKLHCDTEGASIGYQIVKNGQKTDKPAHKIFSYDFASIGGRVGKNGDEFLSERPWTIYSPGQPIALSKGDTLVVKAKRIGYEESTLSYIEGVN
ncbi:MAG TPA: sulfatase [Chryseolinea sp.]|nr:sulfatase [Chryseolinea sp.]